MDPYKPPRADLVVREMHQRHPPAVLVLTAAVIHFSWTLFYLADYWWLVSRGAISPFSVLASSVAGILLYGSSIMFALNPARARWPFAFALVFFGLTLIGLRHMDGMFHVAVLGLASALIGTWLAFRWHLNS